MGYKRVGRAQSTTTDTEKTRVWSFTTVHDICEDERFYCCNVLLPPVGQRSHCKVNRNKFYRNHGMRGSRCNVSKEWRSVDECTASMRACKEVISGGPPTFQDEDAEDEEAFVEEEIKDEEAFH